MNGRTLLSVARKFAPVFSLARLGLLAATLGVFAFGPAAFAADAATGTIQGRVMNGETGTYLDKAVVTVDGSNLQTLTNDFGEYQLRGVPLGSVKITAAYTGQAPESITVNVPSTQPVIQDIQLGAATKPDGTVMLNEFRVAADRYKTAQELAINEERMSVNIKNVVSSEAYGHIADGNIGEFVKFLPGIQVSYGGTNQSDADATGISIRGYGADQTGIMIDGAPVSNPTAGSLTNQVSLNMLSVNNASRIEIIKVPTPDMPQDVAGGYVNIVSRSAFEYSKPSYGGRVYVALNSENTDVFKKTPGPVNKKTYKTIPGADFFVAYPINKTLGFSLSLFSSNQIGENHRDQPNWQRTAQTFDRRPIGGPNGPVTDAAGTAVGLNDPYISRFSMTDSPRATYKLDGSAKIDWRPTPHQTISTTLGISTYTSINADRRLQYSTGTAQDWGPTFVHSYAFVPASASQNGAQLSPGSSVAMTITDRDTQGITKNAATTYQFKRGPWSVKAFGSISFSRSSFPDTQNGHLSGLDISLPSSLGGGGLLFDGIHNAEPGTIVVKSQAGTVTDTTQIANWALASDLRAMSGYSKSSSEKHTLSVDLQRELDFIPWKQHLTAKTGVRQDSQQDIKSGIGSGHQWKYIGTAPLTTAQLLDENYQTTPGYGLPAQQWVDLYKFYDFFKANPTLFSDNDPAVQVGNYNSYVNQQKSLRQTKNAWYGLLDGSFFENRLHLNGGMRQGQSKRSGLGPFSDNSWFLVKNANGSYYSDPSHPNGVRIDQAASDLFATTAAGNSLRSALSAAHITYPDHVISSTTLEGRMLILQPNHRIDQKVTGKPTWSINGSYDITSNLVAKVAWSRSEKPPPLENSTTGLLSGNGAFTLTENTPPTPDLGGDGTIAVANPGLLPEKKTSWNFALDYYTKSGGKLGANYWTDQITNRHQSFSIFNNDPLYGPLLTSLGLDPLTYVNYKINTAINGTGTATSNGWEMEASQDFRFLGDLGRSFRVYGSYTTKKLKENAPVGTVAFGSTADKFGSVALFFNRWRISTNIRATYTDDSITGQSTAAFNGQTYILYQVKPAVWKCDADFNYQLSRRYSFFASGRDIFNKGTETWRYDAAGITPRYAYREDVRRFGIIITAGVQGRF
jgi:iron complex outermembrane recepter protein